jgi:hypothetical protein
MGGNLIHHADWLGGQHGWQQLFLKICGIG